MSRNDKDLVNIICSNCGISSNITYGYYRRNMFKSFYCKKCAQEIRANAAKLSWETANEEERNRRKNFNIGKNNPMNRLNYEEKEKWRTKISNSKKKTIDDLDDIQKKVFGYNWSNLTQNERDRTKFEIKCDMCGNMFKITYGHYRRELNNRKWYCKKCRYKRHGDIMRELDLFKNYRENLTLEEKEKHNKKLRKDSNFYWKNITEKEFLKWYKYQSEGIANSENKRGTTESIFANDLNKYGIEYKWGYSSYPYIHPEFFNIFGKINPITKESINPFHAWDFIIYTKQGNILVDIDGGKHIIPTNNEIGARIQFNDSQRPYQTDGLDAYIILAYNDNITNDTKVLELNTNKYISYKEFINMIQLMNYSNKELREILKR